MFNWHVNVHLLIIGIYLLTIVPIDANIIKTNEREAGRGIILLPEKELRLMCSLPTPPGCELLQWRKGDKPMLATEDGTIIISNCSLVIKKAKEKDNGDYTCFTSSLSATIKVRSKPVFYDLEEGSKTGGKSANIVEGEKLELRCRLRNEEFQHNFTIRWFMGKDDPRYVKPLPDVDNPRLIITGNQQNTSTLLIESVAFTDRAYYVCEADNGVVVTNSTIHVRVKDKLAALWPFLGIVGEVIILCTIIFIYEKRRVKPDFEDSDHNAEGQSKEVPDRSSSSKSQDVRQRK